MSGEVGNCCCRLCNQSAEVADTCPGREDEDERHGIPIGHYRQCLLCSSKGAAVWYSCNSDWETHVASKQHSLKLRSMMDATQDLHRDWGTTLLSPQGLEIGFGHSPEMQRFQQETMEDILEAILAPATTSVIADNLGKPWHRFRSMCRKFAPSHEPLYCTASGSDIVNRMPDIAAAALNQDKPKFLVLGQCWLAGAGLMRAGGIAKTGGVSLHIPGPWHRVGAGLFEVIQDYDAETDLLEAIEAKIDCDEDLNVIWMELCSSSSHGRNISPRFIIELLKLVTHYRSRQRTVLIVIDDIFMGFRVEAGLTVASSTYLHTGLLDAADFILVGKGLSTSSVLVHERHQKSVSDLQWNVSFHHNAVSVSHASMVLRWLLEPDRSHNMKQLGAFLKELVSSIASGFSENAEIGGQGLVLHWPPELKDRFGFLGVRHGTNRLVASPELQPAWLKNRLFMHPEEISALQSSQWCCRCQSPFYTEEERQQMQHCKQPNEHYNCPSVAHLACLPEDIRDCWVCPGCKTRELLFDPTWRYPSSWSEQEMAALRMCGFSSSGCCKTACGKHALRTEASCKLNVCRPSKWPSRWIYEDAPKSEWSSKQSSGGALSSSGVCHALMNGIHLSDPDSLRQARAAALDSYDPETTDVHTAFGFYPIGYFDNERCEVKSCPQYGEGQKGVFVKEGCVLRKGDVVGCGVMDVFIGPRDFKQEGENLKRLHESNAREGKLFRMPMWFDESNQVYAKMMYHPEVVGFPNNWSHLINHSLSKCNLAEIEYFKGGDASKYRVLYIVKVDQVCGGEELFVDYGFHSPDLVKMYPWLELESQ